MLQKSQKTRLALLRLTPYMALGVIVFTFNSSLEIPDILKSYLILVEAQIGLLALYFANRKFFKWGQSRGRGDG